VPASTRDNRVQWLIRHRSASTSRRTLPARENFWAGDDLLEIVVTTQISGHRYGRQNGGDTVAAFREGQRVESATGRRAPYATAYKTELYATAYKSRPARRA
jgi:hypothetical protein